MTIPLSMLREAAPRDESMPTGNGSVVASPSSLTPANPEARRVLGLFPVILLRLEPPKSYREKEESEAPTPILKLPPPVLDREPRNSKDLSEGILPFGVVDIPKEESSPLRIEKVDEFMVAILMSAIDSPPVAIGSMVPMVSVDIILRPSSEILVD